MSTSRSSSSSSPVIPPEFLTIRQLLQTSQHSSSLTLCLHYCTVYNDITIPKEKTLQQTLQTIQTTNATQFNSTITQSQQLHSVIRLLLAETLIQNQQYKQAIQLIQSVAQCCCYTTLLPLPTNLETLNNATVTVSVYLRCLLFTCKIIWI